MSIVCGLVLAGWHGVVCLLGLWILGDGLLIACLRLSFGCVVAAFS